jgi:anti-sigma factor ChrR (cupin superfamily)
MNEHVDEHIELLAEYAAGTLPSHLTVGVETHLPGCERCAQELAVLDQVYAALPLALSPEPPPAGLRERILQGASRVSRFDGLVARVAGMLDHAADKARELLALIDDAAVWVGGPAASRLIHLPPGPAVAGANCGFVHVPAGESFPFHRHLGDEHVLVLQGSFRDESNGRVLRKADEAQMPAGSAHTFTALSGADLIYLVVLRGGLEIPSEPGFEL